MGDERLSEKVKQQPITDDPVKAKRADDAVEDTAHADRQIEMRGRAQGVAQGRKGTDRAGFVELEAVDHRFEGVGDQSDASAEMTRILDAGTPVAGLAAKVQNLDHIRREEVAKRIADVAKVATGNEVLQIGDLVGLSIPDKLRAALASKTAPTQNALLAHATELSIEDRVAFLDEPTRKLLATKYAAPGEAIPGISTFPAAVRKQQDLVAWYLRTTPPRTAALAILRTWRSDDENKELADVMNAIGHDAWQWALSLDAATAQMTWSGTARDWAKLTNQPDVSKHLEAIAPKNINQPGSVPGGAKTLQDLVPASGVDVGAVIAALQDARTHEKYLKDVGTLAKSPYRERLIAAATLDQIELITNVFGLGSMNDVFEWYLDSPHASPEALRPILSAWDESWIAGVAERPKLLAKAMSKFPAAGPTDLFGARARTLYPVALKNAAIRKWCTVNADPRDLLMLVTHETPAISKMWKGIVADGVPADWYKGLGTGVGDKADERLRKLALNTPDHAASEWIRHTLIGDFVEGKVSSDPQKIPDIAYEADAGKRFQKGLASDETVDMGQRTAELSDEEVAKLRANPDQLAALLPKLSHPWLLHDLLRIEPSLSIVLLHASLWDEGLGSYIRTRPASETTAAFANDDVEKRITRQVKTPFETLPALREPAVLASILTRASTMTWLLQRADPLYVMSLFAHPMAGKAAAKIFTAEHADLVPSILVRKEDQAAVSKFAAFLKGDLASDMAYKAEPPEKDEEEESTAPSAPPKAAKGSFERADVQARHEELEAALATGDLKKGLELVLKDPVSLQNVLSVCRDRAQGAAVLVGKPENEELVKKLRATVEMSPLALFPSVPYYAYFHTQTSRDWLFKHEDAMVILREVANDPQLMHIVVDKLDAAKDPSIDLWLNHMPKGTSLSAGERKLVKRMFEEAHTPLAARKMFEIRFGTRMTPTFTKEELVTMWQLLERVPDSHIEMGAVRKFTESKDLGGFAGLYSSGDHRIDIEDGLPSSNKPGQMYDQKNEMTREQLVAAYGYNDGQIKAKVTAGEITEKKTAKGTRYVINPVTTNRDGTPLKALDTTVLHEIGHAVDDMLGDHTELVYGLAGWREFGESDIEDFAKDLGGWERVKPDDQTKIKDAWAVWLNSRTDDGLDKFVPENHVAIAEKYKGVGIVDLARKKQAPNLFQGLHKGQFTLVNHRYQRLYRVPDKTRNAAPTAYAMTAPAEWFAECYAEYYREYQKPGDQKGGHLAGWIKGWFDQNIDNLQYNPERMDRR